MRLDGIEFGQVFTAPGAQGFFGEGYPFHKIWKRFGMTWEGMTFVAKTTTLESRAGNMPLKTDGITPKEFIPRCIIAKLKSGHVLNAVGLSGPGAKFLFETGRWQRRTEPFMLSFMSVAGSKDDRLLELRQFVQLFKYYLPNFRTVVALQINFACPNVGLTHKDQDEWLAEIGEALDIASELDIPLVPNFNPTTPSEILLEVAKHKHCAALWVANTIPWGTPGIPWKEIFGNETSPLLARGFKQPGGLSSPLAVPIGLQRLEELHAGGVGKHIVIGNGLQNLPTLQLVLLKKPSAVAYGVLGMVRPGNMRSMIDYANEYPMKVRVA